MEYTVECRSEMEYAERPIALLWQGQRLAIEQISARWRTPEGNNFRVLTADNQVFDLLYSQVEDSWIIKQIG